MLVRVVVFALLLGAVSRVCAQEALSDGLPTSPDTKPGYAMPGSAWLDLRQTTSPNSETQDAPPWVEAVTLLPVQVTANTMSKSVFRIRVTQPTPDYQVLFFRLFFDDKPGRQPELVAWDESGTHVLRSGPLGSGINLPSSDSVMIPMTGASSIDIEVPGDGKTVRAAYLDWMTSSNVVHPLNADRRDVIPEPFSSMPPLHAPLQDAEHFGTVTATLAAEAIQIGAQIQESAAFQFGIEAQPLAALLTPKCLPCPSHHLLPHSQLLCHCPT